ncbi:MAG: asparagine synthase (glutamine-hydrolyzing) [Candidatus Manganitrophus sp.]|nr:MAG: asparagine synthase (glutamine-hydrolyzing) [Candidatus Manganitrophus sp.]
MCGLSGCLDLSRQRGPGDLESIVTRMADALAHRGPDDRGVWVDPEAGIALGHRRLSIIDLSPEGHQPMASACGRYVIAFNGEVYNFRELRQALEAAGDRFRGHSDTEVMLAAIGRWGVEGAVRRFNGMFAFALWDRKERRLHLVRDRLGEKPLYYGWMGKAFLFGSELKSLCAHPEFLGEVDRDAMALYLRHNYIPAPYSIYKEIYKLPAGMMLVLNLSDGRSLPKPAPYWSFREAAESGGDRPFEGSYEEAIDALEILLRDAIKLRMEADVPLGAFLSGGIDSSVVVALMQAQSKQAVKTFTIGFGEKGYNEADHAKTVAQHLQTDHTELYVTSEEAMAVIPSLPTLYDEPFADSSQIPTYLVSKLARRHVTVSLSGDGGDELFGGYSRYFVGEKLWNVLHRVPGGIRRIAARGMAGLSFLDGRASRLADVLEADGAEAMYRTIISHTNRPADLILNAHEPRTVLNDRDAWIKSPELFDRMMYFDTLTYLPEDILTKIDRASMGVSLEARVPLLDHRVVEFAWRLPLSMKVRNGRGKWPLRQILSKYVPPKLFERPKMGFGIPLGPWLREPLREWGEDLLNEKRLRSEGFFDPALIRRKWEAHLSGRDDAQYYLWNILLFQSWLGAGKGLREPSRQ